MFSTIPLSNINQLKEKYDFIVIGSGFCGYAVASRILHQNKKATVLVIEKGSLLYFENVNSHWPMIPNCIYSPGVESSQDSHFVSLFLIQHIFLAFFFADLFALWEKESSRYWGRQFWRRFGSLDWVGRFPI